MVRKHGSHELCFKVYRTAGTQPNIGPEPDPQPPRSRPGRGGSPIL
jgi:hypothetical protein